MWVAGADGCKGGWIVVLREVKSRRMEVRLASRIADVLRWKPSPKILGVDIPIGLLDRAVPGGRTCDEEARKLPGVPAANKLLRKLEEVRVALWLEREMRRPAPDGRAELLRHSTESR